MLVVYVSLIIILLTIYVFSRNYKKQYFLDLDKKEHPLKGLYPVGIWIMDIVKKVKNIVSKDKKDGEDSKFEAVYVRADKEKMRAIIDGKRGSYLWIILLIGSVLALGLDLQIDNTKSSNELSRQPFGEGSTTYQVEVDGIDESSEVIELEVSEQAADEEELESFFAEGLDMIKIIILNGNTSLDEVKDNLDLVENTGTGISLQWETDYDYINEWGEILAEEIPEDGIDTTLTVKMSYGDYEKTEEIPITILPKPDEETALEAFVNELKELETRNKENSILALPDTFNNKSISYKFNKENDAAKLFAIFLIAAMAVCYALGQDVSKSYKKRNDQLLMDYAELVSKLTVLVGAGMTIKSAWERIVNDYKKSLEESKCEKRYVYEEMLVTYYSMQSGVYEGVAYGEFGRRCGLYQYLKLGGILEQNVKKGVKGMSEMLEKEAIEAFEEQKNIAKQFGQQASTKLLLPMVMMLGIVIVVVTVPAFMSFSL